MTHKQYERITRFYKSLENLGFTRDEADALRRIEMKLSRWSERECNGEVERDEDTQKTYILSPSYIAGRGEYKRWKCADLETGALKRLDKIINERNERYKGVNGAPDDIVLRYHQGDPRGCSLYVIRKSDIGDNKIDTVYTRGVAVCY
jgi:hypothetical protein